MTVVRLVGASGRVGTALAQHLAQRFDVERVDRRADEMMEQLADRAVHPGSIVLNAAGVAHIEGESEATAELLRRGNVDLPTELARAALRARCSLVHISSVKAERPSDSLYAASKRAGDDALSDLGPDFARAGLRLVSIRPLALLFPPLDAGKISRLRLLGRVPDAVLPPLRVPVLPPLTFLSAVESTISDIANGSADMGFAIRRFGREDHGTLRDVAAAFRP